VPSRPATGRGRLLWWLWSARPRATPPPTARSARQLPVGHVCCVLRGSGCRAAAGDVIRWRGRAPRLDADGQRTES
jgi:hypothetical protein